MYHVHENSTLDNYNLAAPLDMRIGSPDCPNIMSTRRQAHNQSSLWGESVSASRLLSRGDYGVIKPMSTCVLQNWFVRLTNLLLKSLLLLT